MEEENASLPRYFDRIAAIAAIAAKANPKRLISDQPVTWKRLLRTFFAIRVHWRMIRRVKRVKRVKSGIGMFVGTVLKGLSSIGRSTG